LAILAVAIEEEKTLREGGVFVENQRESVGLKSLQSKRRFLLYHCSGENSGGNYFQHVESKRGIEYWGRAKKGYLSSFYKIE